MTSVERLKQLLEDPEYQKELEKFAKRLSNEMDRNETACEKIEARISNLSHDEFLKLILRFTEWETKFEERLYKRHICGDSNLLRRLFDTIWAIGYKMSPNREMFLERKYIYKGLTFKLYVGQGSFVRIMKGKKLIFQST